MTSPLQQLANTGATLWLDSVDPAEIAKYKPHGITGATSNPIIISGLLESGRFDDTLATHFQGDNTDEDIAWLMTDHLVREAQAEFHDDWASSKGQTGWVSFELDPLLEDPDNTMPVADKAARYIELAKKWAEGHQNRMIKVPATEAGLAALEGIAAAGITLNVTLIFSERQYLAARDAIWKGRQAFGDLDNFKSVYSIFVSRVDVYTEKNCSDLSDDAQGLMGIYNAKRIGILNHEFWADKNLPLEQEMIFASTGKKLDWQSEDYYIAAFAGSDIMTNPPETNAAILESDTAFSAQSRTLPDPAICDELDTKVDIAQLEDTLMAEGTAKFAEPHKKLIASIASKRAALV
ncbi:MAG: transaldolase family protein [Planctomycetota bacterium]